MTFKARQVLDDCKLALEFLEQSPNDQFWRVHWFAAVALVRTVGDVLHKVDAYDSKLAEPISDAYTTWKNDRETHSIFWDFIKHERDNLVHQYESDVHPSERISLAFSLDLVSTVDGKPLNIKDVAKLDENIYRPMIDGPWEGNDARDVLQEAIDWWEEQLTQIESSV
jgi:hypothetical protein